MNCLHGSKIKYVWPLCRWATISCEVSHRCVVCAVRAWAYAVPHVIWDGALCWSVIKPIMPACLQYLLMYRGACACTHAYVRWNIHVCIYVCMCVCMTWFHWTDMIWYIYIHICICIYIRIGKFMPVCLTKNVFIKQNFVHVCMYVCMYVGTFIPACLARTRDHIMSLARIFMYVCMYVCMYVNIYAYFLVWNLYEKEQISLYIYIYIHI
jgi:hypothetical protein